MLYLYSMHLYSIVIRFGVLLPIPAPAAAAAAPATTAVTPTAAPAAAAPAAIIPPHNTNLHDF